MKCYTGDGLINSVINKLPFEMHIPGYNWCGPGTRVEKRLERNDPGVNGLDEACKEHDIFYSKNKDLSHRHGADKILGYKAMKRYRANDASWKEKMAALGVAGAMKAKIKLGMGLHKSPNHNYKSIMQQCIKKLQKTKQQLIMSVRFVDESIQILQTTKNIGDKAMKKNKTNNKKRNQYKIQKKKKKEVMKLNDEAEKDKMELADNKMDVDIADSDATDQDLTTGKQRKRKLDVNFSEKFPNKILHQSKRKSVKRNKVEITSDNNKLKRLPSVKKTPLKTIEDVNDYDDTSIQPRLKVKRKLNTNEAKEVDDLVVVKRKKLDMNDPLILPTNKYNRKRKVNQGYDADDDNGDQIPEKIQVINLSPNL